MRSPTCTNPRCIDGWLYNSFEGMIFASNKECECNPPDESQVNEISEIEEELKQREQK